MCQPGCNLVTSGPGQHLDNWLLTSWRYGVIQDLCAVDYHWTRSIATNLDIKTSLKIDDLDTLSLTVFIHHAVL